MERHRSEINHDLICRTPYTIDDVGVRLSLEDLHDFVRYLPADSAVCRAERGGMAVWSSGEQTAFILADIYDLVNRFRYDSAGVAKQIRRYPRPAGANPDTEVYGKGALPADDFDAWWYEKTKGGD